MEVTMETIYQIAVVVIALYVLAEVGAGIYIYRNRRTAIPRLRNTLRNLLGLDQDASRVDTIGDSLQAGRQEHASIERKINYIGKHIQFERQELRRRGILRDTPKADNVIQLKK
jgi:prefoldin subunit 5